MSNKKILILSLTALALTACSSSDEPQANQATADEQPAVIRFATSMDVDLTRAASDIQSIALDDAATPAVYIYRATKTATDAGYGYENKAGSTPSSGTFSFSPVLYYPQDKGNIDVYVYAPFESTASSVTAVPVTVKADQSSKDNYLASDFVHGKTTGVTYNNGGTGNAIGVSLKHDLCKIVLDIQAGNGATINDADVTEVTLGNNDIAISSTVDITNSSSNATTPTGAATIKLADSSTQKKKVAAIIPPQALNNVDLKVKIGSTDYTAHLSSPDTDGTPDAFVVGNVYTYTVKVDLKSISVQVTSIDDWTPNTISDPISVE